MNFRRESAVEAWVGLAESDLRIAKLILRAEPPEWHQVCFHAQQAAEKALKSLLEAQGLSIPGTHDVRHVATLLEPTFPDVVAVRDSAAAITVHAVMPRYPAVAFMPTEAMARKAVADAEAIVVWPLSHLEA